MKSIKYLVVSCDVEALPLRAPGDHVDRLIWGRCPGEVREHGIGLMMDIAEQHGIPITFFLDVLEKHLYGTAIDDVGKAVLDRGHDLQLHAHPDVLPDGFWHDRGYRKPTWSLSLYDYPSAELVLGNAVEIFKGIKGESPEAYRGGAFRFNSDVLSYIRSQGVGLSSNYNPTTAHRPSYPYGFDQGVLPLFEWDNGIIELPIGMLPGSRVGEYRPFELHALPNVKAMFDFMDNYWSIGPDHRVLCLLLHSWSFLYQDIQGHFVYRDDSLALRFREWLDRLPSDIKVISSRQLLDLVKNGQVRSACRKPASLCGERRESLFRLNPSNVSSSSRVDCPTKAASPIRPSPTPLQTVSYSDHKPEAPSSAFSREQLRRDHCNICGTHRDYFTTFGGRAQARCGGCLGFERQRIFKFAYDVFISREFSIDGKDVLACCPGDAEIKYLLKPARRLVTFDVRPVQWFDLQMNISDMNRVDDASFDCLVAMAVLQHVERDHEAIEEAWRVLRPGGRFFVQASNKTNQPTRISDNLAAHYGQEALDKYRVGTYRIYGDLDLIRLMAHRFIVKTFYGIDPITLNQDCIFCGIKE